MVHDDTFAASPRATARGSPEARRPARQRHEHLAVRRLRSIRATRRPSPRGSPARADATLLDAWSGPRSDRWHRPVSASSVGSVPATTVPPGATGKPSGPSTGAPAPAPGCEGGGNCPLVTVPAGAGFSGAGCVFQRADPVASCSPTRRLPPRAAAAIGPARFLPETVPAHGPISTCAACVCSRRDLRPSSSNKTAKERKNKLNSRLAVSLARPS